MHSSEKALDSTLDDKNALQHVFLCNQPEAFTSDLSDDQSRYLFDEFYRTTQSSSAHRTESVSVTEGHKLFVAMSSTVLDWRQWNFFDQVLSVQGNPASKNFKYAIFKGLLGDHLGRWPPQIKHYGCYCKTQEETQTFWCDMLGLRVSVKHRMRYKHSDVIMWCLYVTVKHRMRYKHSGVMCNVLFGCGCKTQDEIRTFWCTSSAGWQCVHESSEKPAKPSKSCAM